MWDTLPEASRGNTWVYVFLRVLLCSFEFVCARLCSCVDCDVILCSFVLFGALCSFVLAGAFLMRDIMPVCVCVCVCATLCAVVSGCVMVLDMSSYVLYAVSPKLRSTDARCRRRHWTLFSVHLLLYSRHVTSMALLCTVRRRRIVGIRVNEHLAH